MGSGDSKQLSGVKEIRKQGHLLLGDITEVILTDTQQPGLMKVFSSPDQGNHKERLRKMRHRRNRTSPYLLNLVRVEESSSNEFCGVTCRLYCFYECYEYDLEELYTGRKLNKERFSEQQLLEIAASVLNGLIFIQDNEMKRCHLSKKSVVFAGSQVKILDQSIVEKLHPYYLLLQRETLDDDVFLAPELLKEVGKSNLDPYLSPKSDIFTLGMLLLHLACLESLASFYDYQQFTVELDNVQAKIDRLRYSSGFRGLLSMMIDGCEETRPGVVTLQERLETLIKFPSNSAVKRHPYDVNWRIQTEQPIPPVVSRKHKTSRSEVNLTHTYSDLDTVKASDPHLPVMLRIPQHLQQPPSVTEIPAPQRTEERSLTDYSTIMNKMQKQKTYQLEDETESQIQPNLGATGQYGESPIRKINGLMDNTFRESTEKTQQSRYGKVVYSHGGYYEGELKNGEPHGNGIFYYRNGKVFYSGSWAANHFDGFGTLHNQSPLPTSMPIDYKNLEIMDRYCLRYEGEFRKDCRQGFGSVYYTNGQKFSGCFKGDKADGYGTFYRKEGPPLNGVWQQNHFSH